MLGVGDDLQRPADAGKRRAGFLVIEAVVAVSKTEQW